MKQLKKAISALMILSSGLLMAQNGMPKWVFPGEVLNDPNSSQQLDVDLNTLATLPQGPNAIDYQGAIPTRTYANFTDDNGDLLFFMVDHNVYDKDGYLLAKLTHVTNTMNQTILNINSQSYNVSIGADVSIVNVPGECDKYYIVFFHENRGVASSVDDRGFYYLTIDMNLPNIFYPSRSGSITPFHTQTGVLPGAGAAPALWYYGRPIRIATNVGNAGNESQDGYSISFTQPKNNERFMYLSGKTNVERFRVTNQGFVDDSYDINKYFLNMGANLQTNFSLFGVAGGNGRLVDSDIIQLPDGNYRLAVPLHKGAPGWLASEFPTWTNTSAEATTVVLDIDAQTGNFTSFIGIKLPYTNTTSLNTVKGIEFSANGDYLYTSIPRASYLYYTDLTQTPSNNIHGTSFVATPLPVSNASSFKDGNIERGIDNKMYFAKSTGLGTLSNSNSPTSTWNSSAVNVTMHNRQSSSPHPADQGYLIPKQLNNENYDHQNIISADILVDAEAICNGDQVNLMLVTDDFIGEVIWSNGNTGTSATYIATAGTNNVYADVFNSFGCIQRIIGSFEAGPFASVSLSANSAEYCPSNGSNTITYNVSFQDRGNSVVNAIWTKDGAYYSSNLNSITANGPGVYCVQITDMNSYCTADPVCITITEGACSIMDPNFNISQNVSGGAPTYTVDVFPVNNYPCAGHGWWVYDFSNGPTNTPMAASWVTSGTLINNTTGQPIQFNVGPQYTYRIKYGLWSSCINWVQKIIPVNQESSRLKWTASEESLIPDNVIYPNPTNGTLNIASELEFQNYVIRNTIGQQIVEDNSFNIDLNDIDNGMYFISFYNSEGELMTTKKFIKN